jgi:carbamoylphosphate synthase large subunit
MKKINVWFNHWFSTAYNIINLIKEDDCFEFHIIGSSELRYSVLESVCNEWYLEPEDVKGEEYVDFCLDFCQKHNIDVFLPHRHLLTISQYKKKFEEQGVKVMVDDYTLVYMLNSKQEAYSYFSKGYFIPIPGYYVVETIPDFLNAYDKIEKEYGQVCIKFVRDEGGKSYRLIDNNRKGYKSLFYRQNSRMTLDSIIECLSEKEKFSPLMVMPYLEGDEISIDCLKTISGTIMIPRIKGSTRFERVEYDEKIMDMCSRILDEIDLKNPCNVQFKYREDKPYFLEINTRMSGGVHMACKAAGVNIPNLAVNKLLGVDKTWIINKEAKVISQVEIPVILN